MKYQVASDGVTMDTVPNLWTHYTASPDATVFTFTIRQGVYFQPPVNTEVTAQDFVASWNAVANSKNWVAGTPAHLWRRSLARMPPAAPLTDSRASRPSTTGRFRSRRVPLCRVPDEPRPPPLRSGRWPTP